MISSSTHPPLVSSYTYQYNKNISENLLKKLTASHVFIIAFAIQTPVFLPFTIFLTYFQEKRDIADSIVSLSLFYNTNHIFHGFKSIFLHICFDSVNDLYCCIWIIEIRGSHRYCGCSCKDHLDCIFRCSNSSHSDNRNIDRLRRLV